MIYIFWETALSLKYCWLINLDQLLTIGCALCTQAAVGEDHVIVVTMEKQVYSWGEGNKGQLGHGNTQSLSKPALVQSLNGKSISR